MFLPGAETDSAGTLSFPAHDGPPGDDYRNVQPGKPPKAPKRAKNVPQPSGDHHPLQLSASQADEDPSTSDDDMYTEPGASNASMPVNQSQTQLQKGGSYRFNYLMIFVFFFNVFS